MTGGRYYVRSKGSIITNAVAAIITAIASFVCSGMYLYDGYFGTKLEFVFATFTLIITIAFVIAAILLIVSLSRFNSPKASSVLAAVSFCITAAYFAAIAIKLIEMTEVTYYLIAFIACILMAILFGLAVISALTGFRIRAFSIIAGSITLAVSLIMPVVYTIESNFFGNGAEYIKYMIFFYLAEILMYLSWLFLGCAVLTHSIKNRVPAAVGEDAYAAAPAYPGYQSYQPYQGYQSYQPYQGYQENQGYQGYQNPPYPVYPPYQAPAAPTPPPAPEMPAASEAPEAPAVAEEAPPDPDSPETKLLALKAKLEYGIITQEEYDRQRAEIINNI